MTPPQRSRSIVILLELSLCITHVNMYPDKDVDIITCAGHAIPFWFVCYSVTCFSHSPGRQSCPLELVKNQKCHSSHACDLSPRKKRPFTTDSLAQLERVAAPPWSLMTGRKCGPAEGRPTEGTNTPKFNIPLRSLLAGGTKSPHPLGASVSSSGNGQ